MHPSGRHKPCISALLAKESKYQLESFTAASTRGWFQGAYLEGSNALGKRAEMLLNQSPKTLVQSLKSLRNRTSKLTFNLKSI